MLLEILFAHLYTSMRDHTNHVANNLARVEKDMFDGHERTTVRSISNISREFLHVEASLANQEESLGNFLDALAQYEFLTALSCYARNASKRSVPMSRESLRRIAP